MRDTARGLVSEKLPYPILEAIRRVSVSNLDDLQKAVFVDWSNGLLTDSDAEAVTEAIRHRRAGVRRASALPITAQLPHRRDRSRSPNRIASRDRRRRLGGSSALPDTIRHHYTEGQRAVLCIVSSEAKARGFCDLPLDKIAALAGVSRTTAQNALREARRLGHVTVTERPMSGRKSLTNLVRIASTEWATWLKRGTPAHQTIGFKASNPSSPTEIKKQEREPERTLPFLEQRPALRLCWSLR